MMKQIIFLALFLNISCDVPEHIGGYDKGKTTTPAKGDTGVSPVVGTQWNQILGCFDVVAHTQKSSTNFLNGKLHVRAGSNVLHGRYKSTKDQRIKSYDFTLMNKSAELSFGTLNGVQGTQFTQTNASQFNFDFKGDIKDINQKTDVLQDLVIDINITKLVNGQFIIYAREVFNGKTIVNDEFEVRKNSNTDCKP